MFLLIYKDYRILQTEVLTDKLRTSAKKGELSVIDTSTMQGLNLPAFHCSLGEWGEIPIVADKLA